MIDFEYNLSKFQSTLPHEERLPALSALIPQRKNRRFPRTSLLDYFKRPQKTTKNPKSLAPQGARTS